MSVTSKISISIILLLVLSLANLMFGSVSIPLSDTFATLIGNQPSTDTAKFIVLESRLPQMLTAVLAGASLAVAGLLLQTLFANPLADTSILGINSGAGLGVALVLLAFGGGASIGSITFSGLFFVVLAAFVGAFIVLLLLLGCSALLRNNLLLLITGVMIGYLTSSVISLLNFSATEQGVHSYILWGMGDFSSVSLERLPWLAVPIIILLTISLLLVKPLNALLLGEHYAQNLGVRVANVRNIILVVTGGLSAVVTAFCGPIGFIGLAVPHIVRLLLRTTDHHILLPMTLLFGAIIALGCNLICHLTPTTMPLNSITSLIGAPIILYVILRRENVRE